jgi:hypothetical protein
LTLPYTQRLSDDFLVGRFILLSGWFWTVYFLTVLLADL